MRQPYVHAPAEKGAASCGGAGKNAQVTFGLQMVTCPLCLKFPELWVWTTRAVEAILHQWRRKVTRWLLRPSIARAEDAPLLLQEALA